MKKILLFVMLCSLIGTASAMNQFPLDEQRQQQPTGTQVMLEIASVPPRTIIVARNIAEFSATVKYAIESNDSNVVSIPAEYGQGLELILNNVDLLQNKESTERLVKALPHSDLGQLISACNFLEIPDVLDFAVSVAGDRLVTDAGLQKQFLLRNNGEQFNPFGLDDRLLDRCLKTHDIRPLLDRLKKENINSNMVDNNWGEYQPGTVMLYSKDGATLITGKSSDNFLDAQYKDTTGLWGFKQRIIKKDNLSRITTVAFGCDNNSLLVGRSGGFMIFTKDNAIKRWTWTQELQDGSTILSLSQPTDTLLLAGSNRGIMKAFTKNAKGNWEFAQTVDANSQPISLIRANADGSVIASVASGSMIKLWKQDSTGKLDLHAQLTGHTDVVESVLFHPKNPDLLISASGKEVKVWQKDSVTGKWTDTKNSSWPGSSFFHITQDGSMLISRKIVNGTTDVWRLDDAMVKDNIITIEGSVLAASPDGSELHVVRKALTAVGKEQARRVVINSDAIERFGNSITFDQRMLLSLAYHRKSVAIDVADYPNLDGLYKSFDPAILPMIKSLVTHSPVTNVVNQEVNVVAQAKPMTEVGPITEGNAAPAQPERKRVGSRLALLLRRTSDKKS